MILSMTGFGRGVASSSDIKVTVDIKSLNSKQLDLMMRVPPLLRDVELEARTMIAASLERGKVDMNVSYETIGQESGVQINSNVISGYKSQIVRLSEELGIPQPADWYSVLLRLPETLKTDSSELKEDDIEAFKSAVKSAIEALEEFRVAEGRKLYCFFISKIENIRNLLDEIEPYEQERIPKIKERLLEQLSRLTSIEFDRGRLEQELIFYIEKLDVTEEKIRLASHLNYFIETMGEPADDRSHQGQGKKLGFIAQEMGREINTLGSKSNHPEMQKIVVRMKDELEQIKEQVLNVL